MSSGIDTAHAPAPVETTDFATYSCAGINGCRNTVPVRGLACRDCMREVETS